MLSAKSAGEYALFSPIQRDVEPKMFDPFFGFAVKGKNSKVRVIVRRISPTASFQDLTPGTFLNVNSESWSYFSRNLSNIQFLASAWTTSTPIEWQVKYFCIESKMSNIRKILYVCFVNFDHTKLQ